MPWKCEKFVSDNCRRYEICSKTGTCMGYSKYIQPINQPKEKPMENRVIFESEEQFVNFWKDLTGCDCLPGTRERIKQAGYIRKSAVEEAEEMYKKSVEYSSFGKTPFEVSQDLRQINNKLYEAIQELKQENERLKG